MIATVVMATVMFVVVLSDSSLCFLYSKHSDCSLVGFVSTPSSERLVTHAFLFLDDDRVVSAFGFVKPLRDRKQGTLVSCTES